MFSTFSNPNPLPYTAMNFNGQRRGIALPNNKANWLNNIYQNGTQDPVYWASIGIVGINTVSKQVVPIVTMIAVKGSVSVNGANNTAILYGKVKEIIIPNTDVWDLCRNYTNAQLGLLPNQNAYNEINQSLQEPQIVVGYEIDLKNIIILNISGVVKSDMIKQTIYTNESDQAYRCFFEEVVKTQLNQIGNYIEF